jgi:hypothetical protein
VQRKFACCFGIQGSFSLNRNVAKRSIFLCFVSTTGQDSGRTNYVDTKEYAVFPYDTDYISGKQVQEFIQSQFVASTRA